MTKKVLIVDDSILMQRLYDVSLKGYRTHQVQMLLASDGREALSKLAEHPDTDLILLDIHMPEMSGLEVLRQVKNEKAFRNMAVVLVSAEDEEADIQRGLEAGASAYLVKPFTPGELHQLVDRVLAHRDTVRDQP